MKNQVSVYKTLTLNAQSVKELPCLCYYELFLYKKFSPLDLTRITRFVQKVSGLTTVHEVDTAYGVLTLIIFNIVPFRSYTLHPTFLPLLETFYELFRDV